MDGDGRPDIVTGNFEGANISVLLNPERSKGSNPPCALSPGPCTLFFASPPNPFGLALADVNGDGKIDVIVAHYSGHGTDPSRDAVSLLLNQSGKTGFQLSQATRYDAGHLAVAVAVGDINGDKHPDIAVAAMGGGGVTVLLGDGHGAFRSAGFWATGKGPSGIAVGDLNGGGNADVVTADTEANQITILLAR